MIIAIDPGTTQSGVVKFENGRVVYSGISPNDQVLEELRAYAFCEDPDTSLAIEMIASYGMPVGREVFETCVWIGRFIEAWGGSYRLIYRKDVKLGLCGTSKAKDANIRQALIDKIGPQGTKNEKGPTYGVKSHAWSALAVAVVAAEKNEWTGHGN